MSAGLCLWRPFLACRLPVSLFTWSSLCACLKDTVTLGWKCSVSDSLWPHGLYSPWDSPGQNTGLGSRSLLQWIFPTQELNGVFCIAGGFFTSWATREAHIGLGPTQMTSLNVNYKDTVFKYSPILRYWVFSGGSNGKKIYLQCRRPGFDPWVGKIPCRRAWQPTPVFLPGEPHGQRNLVGYSPWSHKELDMTED